LCSWWCSLSSRCSSCSWCSYGIPTTSGTRSQFAEYRSELLWACRFNPDLLQKEENISKCDVHVLLKKMWCRCTRNFSTNLPFKLGKLIAESIGFCCYNAQHEWWLPREGRRSQSYVIKQRNITKLARPVSAQSRQVQEHGAPILSTVVESFSDTVFHSVSDQEVCQVEALHCLSRRCTRPLCDP
jgi:hypothetical protein